MKKYTYMTDGDLNASLNAKGIVTCYMVVIEGRPELSGSRTHTLISATLEIKLHKRVFNSAGMVIDTRTGEIVAAIS